MPPALAVVNAPPAISPRARKLSPREVQRLLDAAKTPRSRDLEYLQAVFEGNQYAGRPDFFDDSVPLHLRAPCIVYKLTAVAVESNVAFAMGEGRFPVILSLSSEDDTAFDDDLGLSRDESDVVDTFNRKIVDLARLEQVFRQAYRMAQASRSVGMILGFRAGLPFVDLVWAKLCVPSFGDPNDPTKCTRLEIRYRYTEQWRDSFRTGGEWCTRVWEYLRIVDSVADTVYQPAQIWDDTDAGVIEGVSPVSMRTVHGFGVCPVHWYARNRASLVGTNPDGRAVHDGSTATLERLDFSISQRHRAATYAGDPQTVLSGVSPDETIAGAGVKAKLIINPADVGPDGQPRGQWTNALYGGGQRGDATIRRGVGQIWRIADAQGKATLLTLPGDALAALDNDGKDLAQKACDNLGVVIVDPSAFSGGGDLSGRTLAFIFSKQINLVGQDREDIARCMMLPVINLFYRMILARPTGVYMPGIDKMAPILKRFCVQVAGTTGTVWFTPQLRCKWGDYFEPSDVDESTRTATAISAYTANLITLKSAVEHVRGVFTIGSVDQYVDTLAKETAQRQQDAIANAQAMAPPAPGGKSAAGPSGGNPAASKSPNAAPPASGTPTASRKAPVKKSANAS